ncbi:MAG: hypothetical protein ACFE9R_02345 [Candidatus Hermodarchaeota archaeon]
MDNIRSPENFVPSQILILKATPEIGQIVATEDGMYLKLTDLFTNNL